MSLAVDPRWYVVQVKTGGEPLARVQLERQAFEAFLPMSFRTVRHARRIETVQRAFFPGYLFVRLDVARQRWRNIDGTLGVIRLVKASDRPLPAPRQFVERLREAADQDGVVDLAPNLQLGDRVRLIKGPLAEQIGVVIRSLSPEGRVRVLISILNGQVPVDLPRQACALL